MSWALGLAAIAVCGFLMATAHRDGFARSDVRSLLARNLLALNQPVAFDGCVIEESENRGSDNVAAISLHGIRQQDHWIASQGKAILRIGISSNGQPNETAPALMRGDRVRGWAVWQVPRNYQNPGAEDRIGQLARRGIFILGRSKSMQLIETIPGDCANPWTKFANAVRARVRTSLEPIKTKADGQPAAVLASLVIGDYSNLNSSTREAFQNTGTFHVLVVSGLHVAWIAAVLLRLFKCLRIPERIRYLLAALAILGYACVVGFQASITRCLWVFLLFLLGRMLFRRADALNILFVAALLLIVAKPDWLFEIGFQLSFLSVMAIALTAAPAINSYIKPFWEPLQHSGDASRLLLQPGTWQRRGRALRTRYELRVEEFTDRHFPAALPLLLWTGRRMASAGLAIGCMIVVSLSVQLWIEPLLAYTFNRMSWIGPLANIGIIPLSSLALATGIIGALATFIGNSSAIQIAGTFASLLQSATATIALIPGAWQRCPTPSLTCVTAGMALLLVWGLFGWRRFWIPCLYISMLLACLSFGTVPIPKKFFDIPPIRMSESNEDPFPARSSVLSFAFLDVGEGDSIVIRVPDGRVWVLDSGGLRLSPAHEESAYHFDVGEAVVSRYLWNRWFSKLDRVILSHTDTDHAGGMPAIMRNFKIGEFEYSREGAEAAILDKLLNLAKMKNARLHSSHAGLEEKLGQVTVRTLNPPDGTGEGSANANSLVLQFRLNHFSALLVGDLEKSGEAAILTRPDLQQNLLLKIAHHGSRSATSDSFLDRTHPRWAIISAGRNNPYGHPSPEVLARLRRHGVHAISTMDCGAITFETDGLRYRITGHTCGIVEKGVF